MNGVITAEQAKQITGGRTPLVPVEYEQAVQALVACITLDETKYWSAKADALAAWAKIYRDETVAREARALKLHAYRRMGEIAAELQPRSFGSVPGSNRGSAPGPRAYLEAAGLPRKQAQQARSLAVMPKPKFEELVNRPRPPSPGTLNARRARGTQEEARFAHAASTLRSCTRKLDPGEFARSLGAQDVALFGTIVKELIDWFDEFDRHLK
jgi:hypothetical protein